MWGRAFPVYSASYRPPLHAAPWEAKMKILFSAIAVAALLCGGSCSAIRAQSHVIQTPPEKHSGGQRRRCFQPAHRSRCWVIQQKTIIYNPAEVCCNYAIPADSHPTDEHVVMVSGALTFGMGDRVNARGCHERNYPPAVLRCMPATLKTTWPTRRPRKRRSSCMGKGLSSSIT